MNAIQRVLAVVMIMSAAVAGGLAMSRYRVNSIPIASHFQSAIDAAIGLEHRSTVTITLATTANVSTITLTDAAGNATPYNLGGAVTINGQSALTATMQPDGTTTIPGVVGTSVPVTTPNVNYTLNLSPLSL